MNLNELNELNQAEADYQCKIAEEWFDAQVENLQRKVKEIERYKTRFMEMNKISDKANYLAYSVNYLQQNLGDFSHAVSIAGELNRIDARIDIIKKIQ